MPLGITYMGTKRGLSREVVKLVHQCRDGPFLEVFGGMCSVARLVAPSRYIWANDLQRFSNLVADAYFRSEDGLPDTVTISEDCSPGFEINKRVCYEIYADSIEIEEEGLANTDDRIFLTLFEQGLSTGQAVSAGRKDFSIYNLFTQRFAGTYFGFKQTIEIDSIRCSIDHLLESNGVNVDRHRWLLLALCIAMSKCTTSTRHFAQPLAPKLANRKKFVAQRKRSVWSEWLTTTRTLAPVGFRAWRRRNLTFNEDASALMKRLAERGPKPGVVYADPPYTKDQYSRYYHVYETAVLYDYPIASGRGLYREDRVISPFSLRTEVENAMESLISASAIAGADLIMSYPTNGLMSESRTRIPALIEAHYRRTPGHREIPHTHSTLGASKGEVKTDVTEVLYWVHAP